MEHKLSSRSVSQSAMFDTHLATSDLCQLQRIASDRRCNRIDGDMQHVLHLAACMSLNRRDGTKREQITVHDSWLPCSKSLDINCMFVIRDNPS